MKKSYYSILLSTLLIMSCSPSVSDGKMSMSECNQLSRDMNQTSSNMQIDEATILRSTLCFDADGIEFRYIYYLSEEYNEADTGLLSEALVDDLQPDIINRWCTNPELQPMLNSFDRIGLYYEKENGTYIGLLQVSTSDCL